MGSGEVIRLQGAHHFCNDRMINAIGLYPHSLAQPIRTGVTCPSFTVWRIQQARQQVDSFGRCATATFADCDTRGDQLGLFLRDQRGVGIALNDPILARPQLLAANIAALMALG